MALFPDQTNRQLQATLHSFGPYSGFSDGSTMVTSPTLAGAVWPQAKYVVYVPFVLIKVASVTHGFWQNGSPANGNLQAGIYTSDGVLLAATAVTAQATINVAQSAAIATDTAGNAITAITLAPGSYYMALSHDLTGAGTGAVQRGVPTTVMQSMAGVLAEVIAGTFVLPTVATFATPTQAYVPSFGLSFSGAI